MSMPKRDEKGRFLPKEKQPDHAALWQAAKRQEVLWKSAYEAVDDQRIEAQRSVIFWKRIATVHATIAIGIASAVGVIFGWLIRGAS